MRLPVHAPNLPKFQIFQRSEFMAPGLKRCPNLFILVLKEQVFYFKKDSARSAIHPSSRDSSKATDNGRQTEADLGFACFSRGHMATEHRGRSSSNRPRTLHWPSEVQANLLFGAHTLKWSCYIDNMQSFKMYIATTNWKFDTSRRQSYTHEECRIEGDVAGAQRADEGDTNSHFVAGLRSLAARRETALQNGLSWTVIVDKVSHTTNSISLQS